MSTFATIRSYQELRKAGRAFHGKVLKVIPRPIIVSTATELGLWRKGILVADEDGADVLADRMIYDKRWAGKSALEHFEEEVTEPAWTDDERRFACAMRTAYMSLFEIVDTCPGSHVVLGDRLARGRSGEKGPRIELVDLGLSETALPGALLAGRLLDAGEFSMSAGVGFPFPADRETAILRYLGDKEPEMWHEPGGLSDHHAKRRTTPWGPGDSLLAVSSEPLSRGAILIVEEARRLTNPPQGMVRKAFGMTLLYRSARCP